MLKKAYIEITNRCNLRCAFCPGTKREGKTMRAEEFSLVLDKLTGAVEYIYLHVMGEPLSHPQLAELLEIAAEKKMHVCITTNGTLLKKQHDTLLAADALYKVSVSLHSFEGNGLESAQYLEDIWQFADEASKRGVIVALRLWNEGGAEEQNDCIRAFLLEKCGLAAFPEERNGSVKLREKLYLERAQKFEWPDMAAGEKNTQFCYALRDQVAVLADGTVVPCCLDHEGDIALGNLFTQELSEILESPRAKALKDGFSRRCPTEELCRRCGYATRFTK
ncbi:MAG: radical SAM protein [Oscillospiraceae bacterium]|nr:radical SAM protein [Oscillospiraceae bacterium]